MTQAGGGRSAGRERFNYKHVKSGMDKHGDWEFEVEGGSVDIGVNLKATEEF